MILHMIVMILITTLFKPLLHVRLMLLLMFCMFLILFRDAIQHGSDVRLVQILVCCQRLSLVAMCMRVRIAYTFRGSFASEFSQAKRHATHGACSTADRGSSAKANPTADQRANGD